MSHSSKILSARIPGFAATPLHSPGIGHRALATMKAAGRITRAGRYVAPMGVVPRYDVLDSMGRPQGPLR